MSEISEKDTNERPMREKMAKNTTGVCVPLGPREGAITTQHMANSHQFMLASRAQMAFATNGDIYGRSEKSTHAANAVS